MTISVLLASILSVFFGSAQRARAEAGVQAWVRRYSNPTDSDDRARKVVTDNVGNVVVAGDTYEGNSGQFYMLVIKYSGSGVPLWTNRYNGPSRFNNQVQAVAVDGSDNVFVTGPSYGTSNSVDYATIAYSAAGVPLWTNRYKGSGNSDDYPQAVAANGSGNVFVTGYSHGGGGFYDYATIAYSGSGMPLWTNLYNGPGIGDAQANAIGVDGSGNVIVTGYSHDIGGSVEYVTIAYSGLGVPLWTNFYSGSAYGGDVAQALTVDGSGSVFVTGSSYSIGSVSDYATIAYSGAGVPLWTNLYNGPGNGEDHAQAVAVDGAGNVFVTGYSLGAIVSYYDYATIAYSGTGVALWTNRYNGTGSFDDRAQAVAVDGSGNVFVTGYSSGIGTSNDYTTIKYSGAGVPLWTNRYNGPGNGDDQAFSVALDGGGNVYVTGYSIGVNRTYDYATIAYSGVGVPLWTNWYNGQGHDDHVARGVATDGSGNVVVTGSSAGNGTSVDYATIMYSGAGVPLWTNRYNGPGNSPDEAAAVAVDRSGNVFVTGDSHNGGSCDYATIAYSNAGIPLWTNRYNGLGNSDDRANAVAVDGSGNVFVAGYSVGTGGTYDFATIKYSASGVPLWTNRYNGPGFSYNQAEALAVDGSGNVVVTGSSVQSGSSSVFDYATIKYSGAGLPLWTNRYHGPGNGDGRGRAVAVDGSGNVLVTGYSSANGTGVDYATIKYSGVGAPLWTNRYSGPGNNFDFPDALAVDGKDNIFVTGSSIGIGGFYEYATIAYSGAGVPLWTNRYHGPGSSDDYADALGVDVNGNVYVTGQSIGSGSSKDYATIKYSGAGLPLWTNRYNGPANGDDTPASLAVGLDGSVYVTGASEADYGSGTAVEFATVKYISVPVLDLELDGAGGFFIHVNGSPSSHYVLQRAPHITGAWSNVATNIAPASGVIEYHDTSPLPGQAFYRAVQQ